MASKEGWTHETNHAKITLGKKQYRNMEEWSRPCAVCGAKFSIVVKQNTTGVNSNFGYRTCKEHRGQKPGAPGSSGSTASNEELEKLRMMVSTMKQELDPLYAENRELHEKYKTVFDENSKLKAKLTKYELQPAMEAAKNKFPWGS